MGGSNLVGSEILHAPHQQRRPMNDVGKGRVVVEGGGAVLVTHGGGAVVLVGERRDAVLEGNEGAPRLGGPGCLVTRAGNLGARGRRADKS